MTDEFDAAKAVADVIHQSLSREANDWQPEARAVIDALKAKTTQGEMLRAAILGQGAYSPCEWSRLDRTASTSAQNIIWHAPETVKEIIEMKASHDHRP